MAFLQPIECLLSPWIFLAESASFIPSTASEFYRNGQWTSIFRWSRFQPAWFAKFWTMASARIRDNVGPNVLIPLLQGRVRHGRLVPEQEQKPVGGVVVEVGPGNGIWVSAFSEFKDSITKVYGVEPNINAHPSLRKSITDAGLDDVYEIVPCGVEDLAASGVSKGSVDCIVSVLCLCGIPEPRYNIRELYSYLKPGGRMYVYEHVQASRHWSIRAYQTLVNLFWPHFLNGCELCRDTSLYLREAGPWMKIDVMQPVGEPWYQVIPHVVGVLTK